VEERSECISHFAGNSSKMGDEAYKDVVMSRDPKSHRLEGKNALVTAGTKGIGIAIVERLLQEGATVFLCSRKAENVASTVGEMKKKGFKDKVAGVECHVAKDGQQARFVNEGLKFFGSERIDIVICNAGVNPQPGRSLDMSDEIFDKIIDVNYKSFWQLAKLTTPYVPKGGSIVFVSSVGGLQPAFPLGLYGISKTAVIGLARVLSQELGPSGIRVNSVCPGIVRTKMAEGLWKGDMGDGARKFSSLGRYGDPVDISGVVAFLASDDASFITGEAIVASGGTGSRL